MWYPRAIVRRPALSDLRCWLDLAPRLEWIFAKTYAETAPHSYVVLGRSPGLTREDYVRAGRVIRTYGEPGKYYRSTNLYLYSEDRQFKYWAMWGNPPGPGVAEVVEPQRQRADRPCPGLLRGGRLLRDDLPELSRCPRRRQSRRVCDAGVLDMAQLVRCRAGRCLEVPRRDPQRRPGPLVPVVHLPPAGRGHAELQGADRTLPKVLDGAIREWGV